jgi:hypothetical protein
MYALGHHWSTHILFMLVIGQPEGEPEGEPEGHCARSVCAHSNRHQPPSGNVAASKRDVGCSCLDDLEHAHGEVNFL